MTAADPQVAARRGVGWWVFVALEVLAVVAVPLLAVVGLQALLDTRAGTFLQGPGPDDPGYQALVEPSPVHVVLERRDGVLTGMAVLARLGHEEPGGAVVLVPPELQVEGQTLADWARSGDGAAVDALARALRLRLGQAWVLDEAGWADVLTGPVELDNPDPVLVDGDERFAAGEVSLDPADVVDFVGLAGNQEPSALLFRRLLLWRELLDQPSLVDPAAAGPGAALAAVAAGPHTVELLPLEQPGGGDVTGVVALDEAAAEALIVELVPFPAGSQPGDRLRVRVLDRTGEGRPEDLARAVAAAGGEVVVVGNAAAFDGEPTEAVIADSTVDEATRRLLDRLGTGTVVLSPGTDDTIDVTVLAGPDLVGRVQEP